MIFIVVIASGVEAAAYIQVYFLLMLLFLFLLLLLLLLSSEYSGAEEYVEKAAFIHLY